MSQVTLTVGSRKYTVACAPGEEDRVASLGAEVDSKLAQLEGKLAPQEAQNLLFAALLLADELRETKLSLDSDRTAAEDRDEAAASALRDVSKAQEERDELTGEVSALKKELAASAAQLAEANAAAEQLAAEFAAAKETAANLPAACLTDDADLAPALERFAEMLENCAEKLEGSPASA